MQQQRSKYFARKTPLTLRIGSKGQILTFIEHGHVVYQVKGNKVCSNIVANTLPTAPSPAPIPRLWGLNGQNSTLSEHVHGAYQIKANHECSNMVAHILPAVPCPPDPGGWLKR